MQHHEAINAIERRAERIGVTMSELFSLAGISRHTWHRWKQPDANPTMRRFARSVEAMNAAITAHERRLLAELQQEAGE